jgi:hypothetical protein
MIDRPEYDPPERSFREPFGPVSTSNARRHADREKKVY